ncbi:MAG TPA: zf-HC2 domain-containing protein [Candidatus Eisenbacteria bacterium]|nr:zf-HC2 domain-containing protein [Candidatus Eisenbacteria bacterium]
MNDINRLTCEEVFRRLDDFLDRELTADEMTRVREHLETCETCAREYAFEEKVLVDLRAKLRRVSAPEDLLAKITRSIEQLKKESPGGA